MTRKKIIPAEPSHTARDTALAGAVQKVLGIPLHPPEDETKLGDYNRLIDARLNLRSVFKDWRPEGGQWIPTCMCCEAELINQGPLKTRYVCEECVERRGGGD